MNFIFGLLIGFVGVGLPNLRTLKMVDGKPLSVFVLHLLSQVTFIIFTFEITNGNWSFIGGNALGGACAITYLTYRRVKDGKCGG